MKSSGIMLALAGLGLGALLLGTRAKAAKPAQPTGEPPSWPPCPAQGTRLLLVGDSLAVGLGPRLAKAAAGCGTHFDSHVKGATNTSQWAGWIGSDLAQFQPTAVLVSVGGNDFQRNDPQNVAAAIDKLVSAVRGSGARLLYISPPAFTALPDKIGVRQMWAAVPQLDVFLSEQIDIPLSGDGIHPTLGGYDMLASLLWDWTSNTLG